MISSGISGKILTIGCSYKNPKGGVAQVLNTYSETVFSEFQCVVNSSSNRKFFNVFIGIFSFIRTFFILLVNKSIKIIHIHTASYNSFRRSAYFVKLGKFFNKKVIIHIHGAEFHLYYKKNKVFVSKILELADVVVALSESWKAFLVSEMNLNQVIVVPNIVNNPKNMGFPDDGLIHVLFMGILDERKGVYDLLTTISEHRDVFLNKIVVHVGGNGDVRKFEKTVSELSLGKIVKYEGWVSGFEKERLLSLADIYILPSYNEGLPISILEAMSYGLPILSTPVGGIPEVVEHGKNGFLFEPGNRDMIFGCLNKLVHDNDMRKYMGEKSLEKITPYLPQNVEHSLELLYMSLL